MPLIADVWEHDFNEIAHLSTVHAKYGSHHLQKEVADNTSSDGRNKNSNSLKAEDQVQLHVLVEKCFTSINNSITESYFARLINCMLPSVIIFKEGPPPKFLL